MDENYKPIFTFFTFLAALLIITNSAGSSCFGSAVSQGILEPRHHCDTGPGLSLLCLGLHAFHQLPPRCPCHREGEEDQGRDEDDGAEGWGILV